MNLDEQRFGGQMISKRCLPPLFIGM